MKKQTAVEWLIEQWPILESQIPERILEQAKEMEKEQITDACKQCSYSYEEAEQYYNETFKSE
jgi:heterodisulfide reductase subunit B